MKKNIRMCLVMALVSVMTVSFNSCDDDRNDTAKPKITLTEVGHDNSRHAHPGHDLHLEADIVAEGLIRAINVEIHQEDGSFEIEKSFVEGKYIGVRNVEFHEHTRQLRVLVLQPLNRVKTILAHITDIRLEREIRFVLTLDNLGLQPTLD